MYRFFLKYILFYEKIITPVVIATYTFQPKKTLKDTPDDVMYF